MASGPQPCSQGLPGDRGVLDRQSFALQDIPESLHNIFALPRKVFEIEAILFSPYFMKIDLEPEGRVYVIIDLSGSSGEVGLQDLDCSTDCSILKKEE
ncbi:hypothetical protein MG293_003543 [Ovis ammon polii]|uniref:Uncharacterized protein n=1 Tax=Ovis ammon polii TaxID=230172 RepID=A0AAD4YGJ3_OVIAM|nr:hypothetical protein MG293_003543 [Ovis ammon polii]